MKKKDLKKELIDNWAGAKAEHSFFKTISDDAFLGYITAMMILQYNGEWSPRDIYDKATELLAEGKL